MWWKWFIFLTMSVNAKKYCRPGEECWPQDYEWEALNKTVHGKLVKVEISMYDECLAKERDSMGLMQQAPGICMQFHKCAKKSCTWTNDWNLPAYSIAVEEVVDVQEGLKFANEYNIEVSVKNTGHSFTGASIGNGTLMLWVQTLRKYVVPGPLGGINGLGPLNDTCGTLYPTTLKIGGGQSWGEVYAFLAINAQQQFHIAGGSYPTVSATGGWLQGVGLSPLSRYVGTGVQNVLSMEVVLPNGTFVTADACTNSDLYWALRGGGGGTYGVVTSATSRLYPAQMITKLEVFVSGTVFPATQRHVAFSFLEKLMEWTPKLDKRWCGYWSLSSITFYFHGNASEANELLVSQIYDWKASLPAADQHVVTIHVKEHPNFFYAFDIAQNLGKPFDGMTGQTHMYYGSRLIPRKWFVENNQTVIELLEYLLYHGQLTGGYFLGGMMEESSNNDTSVHPTMWKALWQIEIYDPVILQHVRDVVGGEGVSSNHVAHDEPNWKENQWGPNYKRLLEIKRKYDPDHRFNCFHCVGYEEEEENTTPSSSSQTKAFLATIVVFVVLQSLLFY